MRKSIGLLAVLTSLGVGWNCGRAAECTSEFSVQVSATVQAKPPEIRLSWPRDGGVAPTGYTVYRKGPGDEFWGRGIALPAQSAGYVDADVRIGTGYEYQVVKATPCYSGYGYVYSGIELPVVEDRGKLLLVLDKTYAADLTNELAQLEQDLAGDGWSVLRLEVNRHDSVLHVKDLIKSHYHADPTGVKCVFLFGHVPVPYSGNLVPDGHAPDHQGAWPCDGFYGDMDGLWTDQSVNVSVASDPRNRNVPGDGKFDQSTFPAPLKLMVGRVDLSNLPGRLCAGGPATFPNECELLRNYLHKDHRFRTRQFNLPRRGVVGDYFGVRDGEAFAASGWRNFAAFFTSADVRVLPRERTWIQDLATNAYLWAYGCGPGTYTSIGGLGAANSYNDGVSTDLVRADVKAVFTLMFGSWLGDWDSEDDLQRSILATPSYGLTCAWSGRPHWFLQHMAMGEPIGFSTRLTQNNRVDGLYHNQQNNGAGQVHIALMGDPTLRMHVVAPPTQLEATLSGSGVELRWRASQDSVLGYYVYRADNPKGPFLRLTSAPVTTNSFADSRSSLASTYLVRGLKLETSGSGTYYNLSQGAFLTLPGMEFAPPAPPIVSTVKYHEHASPVEPDLNTVSSTNGIPSSTGHTLSPASLP